jgi:hypothetical protein
MERKIDTPRMVQKQVDVGDPLQHLGEGVVVHPAAATEAAPQAVRAVVLLDRGEQPLVIDVTLGEAPRPHRVVILPRLGRQFCTLFLSASCTSARNRGSSRRSPVSPQRSMVRSRSDT